MQKLIWFEFIGVWGAGKSTLVNKLKKDLKKYDMNVGTAPKYRKLKRRTKILLSFKNLIKTFKTSFFIANILVPHFIYLKIKNNNLGLQLLNTFLRDYLGRISSLLNSKKNYFLWEADFHLIPFLDLKFEQKEKLVNLLLNITKAKCLRFVYLDTPFKKTIKNIELDQSTKKNIRFSIDELKIYKEYQANAIKEQEQLIQILKSKEVFIYRIDVNQENYNILLSDILKNR